MSFKSIRECSVENKGFSIDFSKERKNSLLVLTKKNYSLSFEITLESKFVIWLAVALDDLPITPFNQQFFRKTLCENGFLWIQNSRTKAVGS